MTFLISAAWALGLAVSPPYVEVDAAPGSVVGRTLAVRNTASHPVEVRVYLNDWWYTGEEHVFAPVGTIERSAAEWSSVGPTSFRLAADERREVQLEIRLPPDASGGFYSTVMFETVVGAEMRTGMRIASLVMIDTGDSGPVSLQVGSPLVVSSDHRAEVSVDIAHLGQTHTFAQLKGIIRRQDGPVVTRIASPETRFLPGQKRTIRLALDAPLESGVYSLDGVVVSDNTGPVALPSTLFTVE